MLPWQEGGPRSGRSYAGLARPRTDAALFQPDLHHRCTEVRHQHPGLVAGPAQPALDRGESDILYRLFGDDRAEAAFELATGRPQGLLRAQGVERALLTCDDNNVASATIIERLGGVHEDTRIDPEGVPRRRYWVR